MLPRDEALAVTLAVTAALLMVILAVIAGASAGPSPVTQGGAPDPACVEWTDSCVVCSRTAQGLACSTPGIACTPAAARCLRR
ncbi:hypothetical protein [Microvirga sp. CF3016]|uniref:hypothetical protein n=1 Tax=Microvirga sp. CF3016 TaxID=3110181 RepID=UPI002E771CA7|nr:hypothetical protein [Microvirga sp. CF3016]MEE1611802.1 hypothetical protein [Microvirga sp. CF3016]